MLDLVSQRIPYYTFDSLIEVGRDLVTGDLLEFSRYHNTPYIFGIRDYIICMSFHELSVQFHRTFLQIRKDRLAFV
jgi:hypothetical protein